MRNGFLASIPSAAPVAGDATVVVGTFVEDDREDDTIAFVAALDVVNEVTAAAGVAE